MCCLFRNHSVRRWRLRIWMRLCELLLIARYSLHEWKNDLFECIECDRHISATVPVIGVEYECGECDGCQVNGHPVYVSRQWFIYDSNTRRTERKNRNENMCKTATGKWWNKSVRCEIRKRILSFTVIVAHPFSNQTFAAVYSSSSVFVRCSVYRVLLSCFIACRMSTRDACVSDIEMRRCQFSASTTNGTAGTQQSANSTLQCSTSSVRHLRWIRRRRRRRRLPPLPVHTHNTIHSSIPLVFCRLVFRPSHALTTSDKHNIKFRYRANCCDVNCMNALYEYSIWRRNISVLINKNK